MPRVESYQHRRIREKSTERMLRINSRPLNVLPDLLTQVEISEPGLPRILCEILVSLETIGGGLSQSTKASLTSSASERGLFLPRSA